MKKVGRLYFSEIVRCWYDAEHTALYVYGGKYVRYDYISELVWFGLQNNPSTEYLKQITNGITPAVVASVPKGLPMLLIYPNDSVDMFEVNSSNVKAIGYDEEKQIMYVQFLSKGNPVYEYLNVPLSYWQAVQTVESVGSWVHWFLVINDGEFPYRKNPTANLVYTGQTIGNGVAHPNGYMVDSDWE